MTQRAATQLPPNEYDPKVPGLYLRHRARGAAWYLYYRTKDGVARNPKLGDQRVLNRTQAREMAAKLLLEVTQGKDPKREAERQKQHTMLDLSLEYEKLHSSIEVKPSTKALYDLYWAKHILPHFGKDTPVRQVTSADLIKLKSKLRKHPVTFNRVSKVVAHAFVLAEEWGWRDQQTNPCYKLRHYRETPRTRMPSPDEAKRLIAVMKELEATQPWFVGMLLLLCLTGARRGEIMTSKREWWQGNQLVLPDSKTGAKIIPLNTQAQAIAAAIPEVQGNPYLIVGRRSGAHLASPKGLWRKLCKSAGIAGLNMHDLRRFFASVAVSSGQTIEQTMQLMGHTQAQTTKRYAFLMTPERLAAMQATGDRVMMMVEKKAPVETEA
jgi:integrase